MAKASHWPPLGTGGNTCHSRVQEMTALGKVRGDPSGVAGLDLVTVRRLVAPHWGCPAFALVTEGMISLTKGGSAYM